VHGHSLISSSQSCCSRVDEYAVAARGPANRQQLVSDQLACVTSSAARRWSHYVICIGTRPWRVAASCCGVLAVPRIAVLRLSVSCSRSSLTSCCVQTQPQPQPLALDDTQHASAGIDVSLASVCWQYVRSCDTCAGVSASLVSCLPCEKLVCPVYCKSY
jgi:hypothetical protein